MKITATTLAILVPFFCYAIYCGNAGGRWDRYTGGGRFAGAGPEPSPNGKMLVFSSPDTGHGDIYVRDIVLSKTKKITSDKNYEGDPTFSSDGKKLAFIREKDGNAHIWMMNVDGSEQVQLTNSFGYDCSPSFSRDNRFIVFSRFVTDPDFRVGSAASSEIFMVDVSNQKSHRITNNKVADFEPSFSPDGNRILFDVWAKNINISKIDGSDLTYIVNGASASYSPNGKQIVYVSGKFGRKISLMDLDSKERTVIVEAPNYMSHPTFSSDGKYVFFLDESNAKGIGTVKRIDLHDKSVVSLFETSKGGN